MSNRYQISGICDILALQPDQRERCCADLLTLGLLADADGELRRDAGLMVSRDSFVWVDDGIVGNISGVVMNGQTFNVGDLP